MAKEKAIYMVLNMMKLREANGLYIGFLWAPVELEAVIKSELTNFQTTEFQSWRASTDYDKPHDIQPPTYFKTNDVTAVPQLITNTYGVPSYQEANPSCFSVVTFPFLFAVMFGDYGHGSLILFVGTCMVVFNDYLQKTAMRDALQGRYLFFMMGLFSCYNGLLYNEWFAIPYPWFNSCYVTNPLPPASNGYVFPFVDFGNETDPLTPQYDGTTCVYPFGMDPTWFLDSNDILVVQNSMKMKISVIIAVLHMTMGIVVKGMNARYFKQPIVFWFEVVTGIIILNGLFGWMDVLIFVKWFYAMNPYSTDPDMVTRINQAPSIITIMINNFLAMGKQPFETATGTVDVYLFPAQRAMSEFLVVVVLICVPFMLFVKPCSAACCPKWAGMDEYIPHAEDEEHENHGSNPNGEEQILVQKGQTNDVQEDIKTYQELLNAEKEINHGHSVNELFIHQLIETIEFVLGAVSNTASYLRLWALSLAHSQLALVFLQEILQVPWNTFSQTSIAAQTAGSFLIWFPFMAVSFAVLMMMDVLECFLHTLRLHWVEFQNKF